MSIWYRYVNVGTTVFLEEHAIAKATPRGVRLNNGKLVIHSHTKKFAHRTIGEARVGFLARKRRQLSIIISQQQDVTEILTRKDPFENSDPVEFAGLDTG